MASELPWMPFYASDWLSSASICGMSGAEEAAYLRLILNCWISHDGTIPDDERILAGMARMRLVDWRRSAPRVLACMALAGGRWTQPRVAATLAEQKARQTQNRENGLKSWETRKALPDTFGEAFRDPSGRYRKVTGTSESQSQSQSQKENKNQEQEPPLARGSGGAQQNEFLSTLGSTLKNARQPSKIQDPHSEVIRMLMASAAKACIAGRLDTLRSYLESWCARSGVGASRVEQVLNLPEARGLSILELDRQFFTVHAPGKSGSMMDNFISEIRRKNGTLERVGGTVDAEDHGDSPDEAGAV